jgi:NADH-quinone oxidoreductase subunit C
MKGTSLTWDQLLANLKAGFQVGLIEVGSRPGVLAILKVRPESIVEISTYLRDQGTFAHCSLVAGVDWNDRFEVLYHLWSDALKGYLEMTLELPPEEPHVASVAGIWPGASWHERETWDLLGIRFDGHPDLRRVLMPEGYRFHPLRKSFELREPEELEVKARHV